MRHQVAGRKLRRNPSHRKALLRNLATSLILHERIMTTEAKAKEIRSIAEKLITLAKHGTLHTRRQAAAMLYDPKALQKLFSDLGKRFADREGGYTRVLKLGVRVGDNARMAMVEYLGAPVESAADKKAAAAAKAGATGEAAKDEE